MSTTGAIPGGATRESTVTVDRAANGATSLHSRGMASFLCPVSGDVWAVPHSGDFSPVRIVAWTWVVEGPTEDMELVGVAAPGEWTRICTAGAFDFYFSNEELADRKIRHEVI